MRRMLFTYSILLVFLLLSACGESKEEIEEQTENEVSSNEMESDVEPSDSGEAEEEKQTEATLTGTESIAFEEADEEKAVRLVLGEMDIPFEVESASYHLYYGDYAFVTAFLNEGAFAYDLNNNEVSWSKESALRDYAVHKNTLYMERNNRDIRHLHIEALSFADGEVEEVYENQEMQGARKLQVLDDYILYTASYIDDSDGYLFFQIMNKETQNVVEIPVISGDEFTNVELDDGVLVANARETDEPDSSADTDHFVNVDKETGERLYKVEANAVRDTPVRNEHAVYYFDHFKNQIKGFDLEGKLIGEIETTHPDGGMIIPIVTEESLIAKDREGIAWYETDLSSEKHRVALGDEYSKVYEMQATEDRLYVILGEGEESRDDKDFYVVELDINTGEIYEKIDLGIRYDANPVITNYSYQDKVYFSMNDEANEQRVDYIFSNSGVHQPFEAYE